MTKKLIVFERQKVYFKNLYDFCSLSRPIKKIKKKYLAILLI